MCHNKFFQKLLIVQAIDNKDTEDGRPMKWRIKLKGAIVKTKINKGNEKNEKCWTTNYMLGYKLESLICKYIGKILV